MRGTQRYKHSKLLDYLIRDVFRVFGKRKVGLAFRAHVVKPLAHIVAIFAALNEPVCERRGQCRVYLQLGFTCVCTLPYLDICENTERKGLKVTK